MFSARIAPGVRIRVTERGLRASVGPRAARLHVGAGRPGVSTGAGPLTFYQPIGAASGRRGPGSAHLRRAERAQEAQVLQDEIVRILALHQATFAPVQRPHLPPPDLPTLDDVQDGLRRRFAAGLGMLDFRGRRAARERAEAEAPAEHKRLVAAAAAEHASRQRAVDLWWRKLTSCDPDTVLEYVNRALDDNEAPAAVLDVIGGELTVGVMVPDTDGVPQRKPATTQAGYATTKAMTKSDIAALHSELVYGHVLVTAKECFAVAPGATSVRVIALLQTPPDSFGQVRVEPLVAARIERDTIQRVVRPDLTAGQITYDVSTTLVEKRVRGRLVPIPATDEPELAALAAAIAPGSIS